MIYIRHFISIFIQPLFICIEYFAFAFYFDTVHMSILFCLISTDNTVHHRHWYCKHSTYIYTVNIVHNSHWHYLSLLTILLPDNSIYHSHCHTLYRLHFPLLLTILFTAVSGTVCINSIYTSTDLTVHLSS